jgi:uncharacterized protein YecA (UPF0149 family)
LEKEVADASVPDAALQTQQGSLSDMAAVLQKAKATQRPQPGESKVKINRNDPCPCGSGLKYKKCGLINAPQHRG